MVRQPGRCKSRQLPYRRGCRQGTWAYQLRENVTEQTGPRGGHEPRAPAHLAVCRQRDQVHCRLCVELIPLARCVVRHAGYFPVQTLDKDLVTEAPELATDI